MTVLVIDIGSSSVRALLYDDEAQAIDGAQASQPHRFTTEPPGTATADALHLRQLVEGCIDEALRHPRAATIDAVGMAAFSGSLLGVDERGKPVTPVYTYTDLRRAADVQTLRIDVEATHQRTGCLHHPAYFPALFPWLRRTEPDTFAQVDRWLDIGAYLLLAWFGKTATSYSAASWSGLLNRAALTWDDEWLALLGLEAARFSTQADYDTALSGLLPNYAKRWPALRETPFCLSVGDGAAANVGSGAVDRQHVALTVGTTAALRVIVDDPLPAIPPGLWGYRVDAGHHLIGGATQEGGNIFGWARDVLALPDEAAVEAELSRREPDAHGLTVLPLLAGERSPGWSADATGAIAGLRLATTPLDLLQAALEGVALRLALTCQQLAPVMGENAILMAGGGALKASPAWAQMIANALNHPLHLIADDEVTARGTAILALRALGRADLSDFPPSVERVITPNPAHAARLAEALARQMALYQATVAGQKT